MILPCGQDDTFFMIGLSGYYLSVVICGICGETRKLSISVYPWYLW